MLKLDYRDDCYALLIEALDVFGDANNAEQLFQMIESGQVQDATVGIASYESFLRVCIQRDAWDKVIQCYLSMERNGLQPCQKSNFYYLLASFRLGSQSDAKTVLRKLMTDEHHMGEDINALVLCMFFPDIAREDECLHVNIQLIREDLIHKLEPMDRSSLIFNATVTLLRSLQLAGVEDQREPNGGLSLDSIELKRKQVWRDLISNLLVYDDVSERSEIVELQ
jgi:hypothetical protein